MRRLPLIMILAIVLTVVSCGKGQHRVPFYSDTTDVDTLVMISHDSTAKDVEHWVFNGDSSLVTMISDISHRSALSGRLKIEIIDWRKPSAKALLILTNGEKFSGNTYDSTNYVNISYGKGAPVKYTYDFGPRNTPDTAYLKNHEAFIGSIQSADSITIVGSTFTSGTLVFTFKPDHPMY